MQATVISPSSFSSTSGTSRCQILSQLGRSALSLGIAGISAKSGCCSDCHSLFHTTPCGRSHPAALRSGSKEA